MYTSDDANAYVERYKKAFPESKVVSIDSALAYQVGHAMVEAMKLAGTTRDADAIRAKLDNAMKALPDTVNFFNSDGIADDGGAADTLRVAIIEDGQVHEVDAAELAGTN